MHDFQLLGIVVNVIAKMANLKTPKKLYSSKDRSPALVKMRDTIFYLLRQKTELSFGEIGRPFGKDHSTVMSAIRREGLRLERNPARVDKLTWK